MINLICGIVISHVGLYNFLYMSSFKNRIEEIRSNPQQYYKALSSRLDLTVDNDLDDLLCLLYSGLSSMGSIEFEEISNLILDHKEFKDNPERQFHYHIARGSFFRLIEDADHSLESYEKAYKLGVLMKDPFYLVRSLVLLKSIHEFQADYETALFYGEQALGLIDEVDAYNIKGEIYTGLGSLLCHMNQYERAEEAYRMSLVQYENVPGKARSLNYCILLLNLGEVCFLNNKKSESDDFFIKGIEISDREGFKPFFRELLTIIGEYYYRKKEYDTAYDYMAFYIREEKNHKISRNKIKKFYKKDKLKEEVLSLSILRKKNEELNGQLSKLYEKLEDQSRSDRNEEQLLNKIGKAISEDRMLAYFQPLYSLKDKKILSAEALVRWIDTDGTIIYPGAFIDVIENSHLIHSLTKNMIKQSFQFCRKIREEYDPHFVMSVNISPAELASYDLVSLIEKELLLNGLYPENVEIEITERTFLEEKPKAINQLYTIKELGVNIALDDFGTGYSSLASLNRIPFDKVKIDKSLVLNATAVGKGDRMLGNIIRLVHDMDLPVVVEGVEKKEHLELLGPMECDIVQGFYYSKAVWSGDFLKLLKK